MDFLSIIWDDPNDPDGNVQHIAEHGLTVDDVEYVLTDPTRESTSKSSGRPVVWGYTPDGRYVIVVCEEASPGMIRAVTAYEVPEP